ncbi:uncharacterized protein LOC110019675 isoform X1 [Phalaenopsis equestris]|uniref:uncharacterized protein LOC110019675 isoform X1 n=1 Tax=Phalaenopsis equestris TaxID=78828 RepID=UPI0009E39062|nr:uncharacterized protein LOC110019675 isoform X1 [Phalaenopsis equestris]
MDLDGQKGAANPVLIIAAAMAERARLQDQLRRIERQAYELETNYLQQSAQCGSVLQGFEGYLSSTRRTNNVRRSKRVPLKDRLFSLSSATSPANSVSSIVSDGIGRRDLAISIVMRQADLKVDGKVGLLKLRQRG